MVGWDGDINMGGSILGPGATRAVRTAWCRRHKLLCKNMAGVHNCRRACGGWWILLSAVHRVSEGTGTGLAAREMGRDTFLGQRHRC
jgi:hypothetical protein